MSGDDDDATLILGQTGDATVRPETGGDGQPVDSTRADPAPDPSTGQAARGSGRHIGPGLRWLVAGMSLLLLILGFFYIQRIRLTDSVPGESARQTDIDTYSAALTLAESAVAENDTAALPARLLKLVRGQEHNADLQALLEDATRYSELRDRLQQRQLLVVASSRESKPFATPLFEAAARQQIDTAMGTAAVLAQLAQAERAWQEGELIEALTLSRQLSRETGSGDAAAKLDHYTRVIEANERLSTAAQSPTYPAQLLTFYLNLDPLRDRFYWHRMDAEFERAPQSVAVAAGQLQRAGLLWESYSGRGGIDGALRQEATASEAFGRRAAELTEAHHLVIDVVHMLEQLPQQTEQDQTYLFREVLRREILYQRNRLEILSSINDDAVLADRLDRLPAIAGDARTGIVD